MPSQKRSLAIHLSMMLLLVVVSCTSTLGAGLSTSSPSPTVTEITVTPTPTPTFTPIPTLSQEEAYSRFEELLLNNGNCRLPCWWGIVPDISSFHDARSVLIPFSGIASQHMTTVWNGMGYGEFDISYPHESNDIWIHIDFSTLPNQNEVSMLHIYSQVLHGSDFEPTYDDPKYLELMENYTLSNILSAYGKPGQVVLMVDVFNSGPDSIYLRLLYPEQGIFIKYRIKAVDSGGQISGCPSKAFIELWLVPPSSDGSYKTILSSLASGWEGFFSADLGGVYKSLEEATSMDIDTFYQTFREPTNRCLETPSSLWAGT